MKTPCRFVLVTTLPLLLAAAKVSAVTIAVNTGSLGPAANATNADAVTFGTGAVLARPMPPAPPVPQDKAAVYNGTTGTNASIPFQSALNPASNQPFTIEFWANPSSYDTDDSPLSNRISAGNRSGWAFFQRDAATGWNFRMYNGNGGGLAWDLTGGTANLNEWTHVVATWNGSAAQLFVNGALVDSVNDPLATGTYNASTSATFFVASTDSGSPYTGAIDEVAFYPTALPANNISGHTIGIFNPSEGIFDSHIQNDNPLLRLSFMPVPEPSSLAFLGLSALVLCKRRRR